MAAHKRIDMAHWEAVFSLDRRRDDLRRRLEAQLDGQHPARSSTEAMEDLLNRVGDQGDMVDGPMHIAIIEQLRRRSGRDRGPGLPVDVCVWGAGEPSVPHATKIGGRPFRERGREWPTDQKGRPLDFLAQFCFTDSLDVLRVDPSVLPGEIMLVYVLCADRLEPGENYAEDPQHVEWCRIADGALDEQHPPSAHLSPAYAELHRTTDYPPCALPDCDRTCIIQGSKFGGYPAFQQGEPQLSGEHLCTLGSLNPSEPEWPLLNVPGNPGGKRFYDPNLLMIGDVGAIYFFIDSSGKVSWVRDCG